MFATRKYIQNIFILRNTAQSNRLLVMYGGAPVDRAPFSCSPYIRPWLQLSVPLFKQIVYFSDKIAYFFNT